MQHPWGKTQQQIKLAKNVYWISTPGHGGMIVHRDDAHQFLLTDSAIKRGGICGNWLCYEEDSAWAIPALEIADLNWRARNGRPGPSHETLMKSLSQCNADYLLERGLVPLEPQFTNWTEHRQSEFAYQAKDPDWILAATRIDTIDVLLTTCDGLKHKAIRAAYHAAIQERYSGVRLSRVREIERDGARAKPSVLEYRTAVQAA